MGTNEDGTNKDGTGISDSVVNQLNNILSIGITNRMDMIDDALLRPGRLELHVEIGLPDHKRRTQILIYTPSPRRKRSVWTRMSRIKWGN